MLPQCPYHAALRCHQCLPAVHLAKLACPSSSRSLYYPVLYPIPRLKGLCQGGARRHGIQTSFPSKLLAAGQISLAMVLGAQAM